MTAPDPAAGTACEAVDVNTELEMTVVAATGRDPPAHGLKGGVDVVRDLDLGIGRASGGGGVVWVGAHLGGGGLM